jgi:hypothetical protein
MSKRDISGQPGCLEFRAEFPVWQNFLDFFFGPEDQNVALRESGVLGLDLSHSEAKPDFNTKMWILGLLHDRVRLDESFPMGPCSTSGDKNSLRYDLGPRHCDCHVSTQYENA